MPLERVLIVGGGLAGPALALALARQAGIHSTIFEIREGPSDTMASISLAPNALRALDQVMGVYDSVKEQGWSYSRVELRADDGSLFGHLVVQDDKYRSLRILRSKLHKELMEACHRSDLIEVVRGAHLEKIEEDNAGVIAHFRDGDLLIGADGIHSKVRDYVTHPVVSQPIYVGHCHVSGHVSLASLRMPPDWTHPALVLTSVGTVGVWPHSDTDALWYVSENLPERGRGEWQEYEKSGEAARAAKSHYARFKMEPIQSMLEAVNDEHDVRVWAPYWIDELPQWHRGRVCLIGDAAHALPPNGQGSALAFEDATYLARLLVEPGNLEHHGHGAIFAQYQRNREPRINKQRKEGRDMGAARNGAPNTWLWSLKKTMIWLFFLWHRKELKDWRITEYDVMEQPVKL